MPANARGFSIRLPRDVTNRGDPFQKVGMFLNCVGSGQQALKGLLIQLQL